MLFLIWKHLSRISGLNSKTAEIIEISALKIENDKVIDEFNTLVKPCNQIDSASTAINGINDDMVKNAPMLSDILPLFLNFIEDNILVGYNIASFDLPILSRVVLEHLKIEMQSKYIDILYAARKYLSFLPNCKLTTVAAYFNISATGAHRALNDCYLVKSCYEKLLLLLSTETTPLQKPKAKTSHTYKTHPSNQTQAIQTLQAILLGIISDDVLEETELLYLKNWLDENSYLAGQYPFDRIYSIIKESITTDTPTAYQLEKVLFLLKRVTSPLTEDIYSLEDITLSGKTICLTGDFNYDSRKEIELLVNHAGGICKSAVSGRTDYVIVGDFGSPDWSCGNYGNKIKRALELQEQGKPIQIVSETVLINFLQSKGVIS